MRRFSAILTMLLCLLCACSSGKGTDHVQAAMDFRADLLSAGGCAFQSECTADWGDTVFSCTLDGDLDPEGGGWVTVLAPESVAGISAALKGGEGTLEYEDVALGLSPLPGSIAPIQLPGVFVQAWTQGWIAGAGRDGDALCVQYELGYGPEKLTIYTWFDENARPLRGELYYDDHMGAAVTLTEFTFAPGGTDETVETDLGQRVPGQSEP